MEACGAVRHALEEEGWNDVSDQIKHDEMRERRSENVEEFLERMLRVSHDLLLKARGLEQNKNIMLVCHGGVQRFLSQILVASGAAPGSEGTDDEGLAARERLPMYSPFAQYESGSAESEARKKFYEQLFAAGQLTGHANTSAVVLDIYNDGRVDLIRHGALDHILAANNGDLLLSDYGSRL